MNHQNGSESAFCKFFVKLSLVEPRKEDHPELTKAEMIKMKPEIGLWGKLFIMLGLIEPMTEKDCDEE